MRTILVADTDERIVGRIVGELTQHLDDVEVSSECLPDSMLTALRFLPPMVLVCSTRLRLPCGRLCFSEARRRNFAVRIIALSDEDNGRVPYNQIVHAVLPLDPLPLPAIVHACRE